jgi:hypothetical protein
MILPLSYKLDPLPCPPWTGLRLEDIRVAYLVVLQNRSIIGIGTVSQRRSNYPNIIWANVLE